MKTSITSYTLVGLVGALVSVIFSFSINENFLLTLPNQYEGILFSIWLILWPPGIDFFMAYKPDPFDLIPEIIISSFVMSIFYVFFYWAYRKSDKRYMYKAIELSLTYIFSYICCLITYLLIDWIVYEIRI